MYALCISFAFFLLAFSFVNAACRDEYKIFTDQHTACVNENNFCSSLKRGVTSAQKQEILDVHNRLREKIASGAENNTYGFPSASNMMLMEWDDELAAVAQVHANLCKFEHDCGECRQIDSFSVGQNLFSRYSNAKTLVANWTLALEEFYSEISFSPPSLRTNFEGGAWGHFTQVVWATTWKVGCGYNQYQSKKGKDYKEELFTCNYGPTGNIIKQKMYATGDPASNCPPNTAAMVKGTYGSLCKAVDASGPQEANTTNTGILFYCAFAGGDNCGLIVDKITFMTKKQIVEGSYLRFQVPANERVRIQMPLGLQSENGFCVELSMRKGAISYGKNDNRLVAMISLPAQNYSVNSTIGSDHNEWTKSDLALEWKYKTNIAWEFAGGANAAADQYFDLKKLLIYQGDCLPVAG